MTCVLLCRSLESVTLPKEIKGTKLRASSLNLNESKRLSSNYFQCIKNIFFVVVENYKYIQKCSEYCKNSHSEQGLSSSQHVPNLASIHLLPS